MPLLATVFTRASTGCPTNWRTPTAKKQFQKFEEKHNLPPHEKFLFIFFSTLTNLKPKCYFFRTLRIFDQIWAVLFIRMKQKSREMFQMALMAKLTFHYWDLRFCRLKEIGWTDQLISGFSNCWRAGWGFLFFPSIDFFQVLFPPNI